MIMFKIFRDKYKRAVARAKKLYFNLLKDSSHSLNKPNMVKNTWLKMKKILVGKREKFGEMSIATVNKLNDNFSAAFHSSDPHPDECEANDATFNARIYPWTVITTVKKVKLLALVQMVCQDFLSKLLSASSRNRLPNYFRHVTVNHIFPLPGKKRKSHQSRRKMVASAPYQYFLTSAKFLKG